MAIETLTLIASIVTIIAFPVGYYRYRKGQDEKYELKIFQMFKKNNYWNSTKKIRDGEIAPFIFFSIEVIRDKEYLKKPLTSSTRRSYDQKLSNFQAWIESHIPKFKKENEWSWIGFGRARTVQMVMLWFEYWQYKLKT